MTRIAVLGGTGSTGSAIAGEAAARGYDVVVRSRSAPADPVPGVRYEQASPADEQALRRAVEGQDVVVEAPAPRSESAGRLEGAIRGADLGRPVVDEVEQRQHRGHIGVAH